MRAGRRIDAVAAAVTASSLPAGNVTLPDFGAAYAAGLTVINAETWAACGELVGTGLVGEDVARRLAYPNERRIVAAAREILVGDG